MYLTPANTFSFSSKRTLSTLNRFDHSCCECTVHNIQRSSNTCPFSAFVAKPHVFFVFTFFYFKKVKEIYFHFCIHFHCCPHCPQGHCLTSPFDISLLCTLEVQPGQKDTGSNDSCTEFHIGPTWQLIWKLLLYYKNSSVENVLGRNYNLFRQEISHAVANSLPI